MDTEVKPNRTVPIPMVENTFFSCGECYHWHYFDGTCLNPNCSASSQPVHFERPSMFAKHDPNYHHYDESRLNDIPFVKYSPCSNCSVSPSDVVPRCTQDDGALRIKFRNLYRPCNSCKEFWPPQLKECPKDRSPLGLIPLDQYCGRSFTDQLSGIRTIKTALQYRHLLARNFAHPDNPPVVIKLLKESANKPYERIKDRFLKQLEQQKKVSHVNLLKAYSAGEIADGRAFGVFEYVPSELSLASCFGEFANLPPIYFQTIMDQLCEGLEHALQHGLVHQDLSPGDILLDQSDTGMLLIKVTGFEKGPGLLHGDNQRGQLTEMGDIFGHPEFMSPEAAQSKPVTESSLVYSVGAIMHFLLSKQKAFEGAHWAAILLTKLHHPAKPLVLDDSQLGKDLSALVVKCLAINPADRPATLSELKAELQQLPIEKESPRFDSFCDALRQNLS